MGIGMGLPNFPQQGRRRLVNIGIIYWCAQMGMTRINGNRGLGWQPAQILFDLCRRIVVQQISPIRLHMLQGHQNRAATFASDRIQVVLTNPTD